MPSPADLVGTYVLNLRGKLEPDPRKLRYLVTEAGLGYRLRAEND